MALGFAAISVLGTRSATADRPDSSGLAALQRIHQALVARTESQSERVSISPAELRLLDVLRDPLWELGASWLSVAPGGAETAEHQVRDGEGAFRFIRLSRTATPDALWTLVRVEHLEAEAFIPREGPRFRFAESRTGPPSAAATLRRCWMRGYETRRDRGVVRTALETWFDLSNAPEGIEDLVSLLADGLREPSVQARATESGGRTVLRVESELGFDLRRLELVTEPAKSGDRARVLKIIVLDGGTIVESLDSKQVAQFKDTIQRVRDFGAGGPLPPVVRLRGGGALCAEDAVTAAPLVKAAARLLGQLRSADDAMPPTAVRKRGVTVVSASVTAPDGHGDAIEFVRVGEKFCLRSLRTERERLSNGLPMDR